MKCCVAYAHSLLFVRTEYTTKDFVSYHFVDVLGGTEEEVVSKVNAFFESPFFASLAPIENAGTCSV